ncbi:hypothetical protein COOONC_15687, partial [Cooperia oncophora]
LLFFRVADIYEQPLSRDQQFGKLVRAAPNSYIFKGKTAKKVNTGVNGNFTVSAETKARSWQRAYGWVEHSCDKSNRIHIPMTMYSSERSIPLTRCDVMSYIPIPPKFKDAVYDLDVYELSKKPYYNSCDDKDNK